MLLGDKKAAGAFTTPPKMQDKAGAAAANPAPSMVRRVPPTCGPEMGEQLAIEGACNTERDRTKKWIRQKVSFVDLDGVYFTNWSGTGANVDWA